MCFSCAALRRRFEHMLLLPKKLLQGFGKVLLSRENDRPPVGPGERPQWQLGGRFDRDRVRPDQFRDAWTTTLYSFPPNGLLTTARFVAFPGPPGSFHSGGFSSTPTRLCPPSLPRLRWVREAARRDG